MARGADIKMMVATALVAVVLLGVLTPVCAMPGCEKVAADSCSDFRSACTDCPGGVVMKHARDDAARVAVMHLDPPVVVAEVLPIGDAIVVAPFVAVPIATAAPPPLAPLGVRLTV